MLEKYCGPRAGTTTTQTHSIESISLSKLVGVALGPLLARGPNGSNRSNRLKAGPVPTPEKLVWADRSRYTTKKKRYGLSNTPFMVTLVEVV